MKALLFAFCLFVLAAPATALSITQATTPPSGASLALAFDAPGDAGSYPLEHGSGIAIDVGQTFRLSRSIVLDKVTLRLRALSNIDNEFVTLSIGSYSEATDTELEALLRVEAAQLPDHLPIGELRYFTFDLTTPVTLPANQQHGFVLGFSGGGGVNDARAEILHLASDLYAGGLALSDLGAFTIPMTEDLAFYLHESGGPAPPPPPATEDLLLLREGRFSIEVYWRTALGTEGFGRPVPYSEQSGFFWFFDAEILELIIKVLDGCALTDHYWVFIGGLTNVEVQITVRDLDTGAAQSYFNPLNQTFAPVLDIGAFDTCP
jgi:hypothetical protein